MTQRERDRLVALNKADKKLITPKQAAQQIGGLSEVCHVVSMSSAPLRVSPPTKKTKVTGPGKDLPITTSIGMG